jgi:hypothetical protein
VPPARTKRSTAARVSADLELEARRAPLLARLVVLGRLRVGREKQQDRAPVAERAGARSRRGEEREAPLEGVAVKAQRCLDVRHPNRRHERRFGSLLLAGRGQRRGD